MVRWVPTLKSRCLQKRRDQVVRVFIQIELCALTWSACKANWICVPTPKVSAHPLRGCMHPLGVGVGLGLGLGVGAAQLLMTKKSSNLSGQKKIQQPLGTQKNHATFQDKKNHANYQDKTKNYTTSLDKKKSNNLSGQKEIMQPPGTKKSRKRKCSTSRDKKIT